jgi:hypothetical protein
MNNTLLWIILGVALVVGGIVVWLALSPHGGAAGPSEAEQPAVSEPVAVEPEIPPTAEPEPVQTESVTPVAQQGLWAVDGVIDLGEYSHSIDVVDVRVSWANDASVLRVGLASPGGGYVAIGFDPEDRMKGANIVIGYVHEGVTFVRDDFGTSVNGHTADTDRGGEDNILSSAGTEWGDHTVIEFVIPLDSGDEMDKPLRPGGTYTILVAYHDLQDGFEARHSRRGTGEITLDPAP